jgi:hypothetical protein
VSFRDFLVIVCVRLCSFCSCLFVFLVFPFPFFLFGLCFRRLVRRAISLVLQSNIRFFFFFCILRYEYYFVLYYVIKVYPDSPIRKYHPIVHSPETLIPRLVFGCIPWHHSPSHIVPVIVFRPLYRTKTVRITIMRVCWKRQLVNLTIYTR